MRLFVPEMEDSVAGEYLRRLHDNRREVGSPTWSETLKEALISGHFEWNEKSKLLILKIPHYVRNDKSE